MGTISLTLPVTGTIITAGLHSTNYTTIQNAINGGLDNNNINASAAIAQSKLAFDAWQAYTPTWSATGSAPSLGNGTLTGRYVQIGKTIHATVNWTAGSTTTYGTGSWKFSLPVNVSASQSVIGGTAYIEDAGVNPYHAFPRYNSATDFVLDTPASPSQGVGPTVPFTFGSSDFIRVALTYEAA